MFYNEVYMLGGGGWGGEEGIVFLEVFFIESIL